MIVLPNNTAASLAIAMNLLNVVSDKHIVQYDNMHVPEFPSGQSKDREVHRICAALLIP